MSHESTLKEFRTRTRPDLCRQLEDDRACFLSLNCCSVTHLTRQSSESVGLSKNNSQRRKYTYYKEQCGTATSCKNNKWVHNQQESKVILITASSTLTEDLSEFYIVTEKYFIPYIHHATCPEKQGHSLNEHDIRSFLRLR